MRNKFTAWDKAREVMSVERRPLALHEFCLKDVSESALGARLREATRRGEALVRFRKGKPFKEWVLSEVGWPLEMELVDAEEKQTA